MQCLFAAELIFLMLIFFGKSGESLNCFVCRSDEVKGCNGVMNESLSVSCPEKPGYSKVYCRKIRQTLLFQSSDETTSIRECAYEKGSSDCYTFKLVNIVKEKICECDNELCNSGNSLKSFILTIFATFCAWLLNYLTI